MEHGSRRANREDLNQVLGLAWLMFTDFLELAQVLAGVLALAIPVIWRTSARLQKIESEIDSLSVDMKGKFKSIEGDVATASDQTEKTTDLEREGRKELWKELSQLRERMVKLETKLNGGS